MVGLKKVASILDEVAYVPRRIYEIRYTLHQFLINFIERNKKIYLSWLSRIKVVSDFVKSMPVILTFLEEKSNDDEMGKVNIKSAL